ncbi:hypothetical protein DI005_33230 [Prauserella sp. PE36]|uniref:hypothetical protein n=1 Tax=Prauserella sp. PE36 TaxID=1504709 RepID=UPI000DE365CF|nr:hypothetical protein [Prauserella sp. PE36]RBM12124.1 hypothetical protein DI005_33230 [Prauserella sp. PE36]
MAAVSPTGLKRLACERYREATGRKWTEADRREQERWLAKTLPVIRAELGIALEAEWRDGAWQAPGQFELFPTSEGAA